MNFYTRANRFPPVLVRLLARKTPHGPVMTDREIATASGLSEFDVQRFSRALDWSCCDVETMRRFTQACRVDFTNRVQMRRVDAYVASKPTWQHLRRSCDWPWYEALMGEYRRSIIQKKGTK